MGDNLRVIDAEPTPLNQNQSSGNSNVMNNALDRVASWSTKFNPIAQKTFTRLSKGVGQVQQFAQERLGTAEDVTELPQEYKDLEKRMDALEKVHKNLLSVGRTYSKPSYDYHDYPVQIQESLQGFFTNTTGRVQNLMLSPADRAQAEANQQPVAQNQVQHPESLSHAFSRAAVDGAEAVGVDEPLGTALLKFATTSKKVGDARLTMDKEIVSKFNEPMSTTLNTSISQAKKAREHVQTTRRALDNLKGKLRSTRSQEVANLEVERAEDDFVKAVERATSLMNAALNNPEPLGNLADLVAAQLKYYKEAQDLLSELAPELDEFKLQQESVSRSPSQ